MAYDVTFRSSAFDALDRLPRAVQTRAIAKASSLADNPRPPGCVKLTGSDFWRVRVGEYRLVYTIDDQSETVDIRIVAHRKDVYRGK
jgi:mRNA interferase RelE/StbE